MGYSTSNWKTKEPAENLPDMRVLEDGNSER